MTANPERLPQDEIDRLNRLRAEAMALAADIGRGQRQSADEPPCIDWEAIRDLVRSPDTLTPTDRATRGGAATRWLANRERT